MLDIMKLCKWCKRWWPVSFEPTQAAGLQLLGKLPLKEGLLLKNVVRSKDLLVKKKIEKYTRFFSM